MCFSDGYSQDFIDGINMFNRGRYDSLTFVYAPEFIRTHPHEEGLARYFVAESYYNKALSDTDLETIRRNLELSWNEFRNARGSSDLSGKYPEYYGVTAYKMGWCSYRLAELNVEPIKMLQRANSEFRQVPGTAPDSVKVRSYYMAAETKIREILERYYELANEEFQSQEMVGIETLFDDAERMLNKVIHFPTSPGAPHNLMELKAVSKIRKESLSYYLGRYYATMPTSAFENVTDSEKIANPRTTALSYFRGLQYDSLFVTDPTVREKFKIAVHYLKLMKHLNQYILTKSSLSKHEFLREWENVDHSSFVSERAFRMANLYQSHPITGASDSTEFAMNYYQASADIPESYYWLAYLQMVYYDRENSRKNYQNYIDSITEVSAQSDRILFLLDDARYQKFLLDFEFHYLEDKRKQLKELATELQTFSPTSQIIKTKKAQLSLLVDCSLTSDTSLLLKRDLSGSEEEKLDQVVKTVKFILPRAALNIGIPRQKYLALLDRLLAITKRKRPDETYFFRGIVKTLEADLQASPIDKMKKFREAANVLKNVTTDYPSKSEAEYIRASCLFFADEFDEAEVVFRRLINENRYLRALFYLAEIYRITNRGTEAKKCYKVIIDKLQGSNDDYADFWLDNAKAGLESLENPGKLERIEGIDIEHVDFQAFEQDERVSFEKLANEKFLSRLQVREIVNWFMIYGLPQKEIYPSQHKLSGSVFVLENIFDNVSPLINERKGVVTATLNLTVHLPNISNSDLHVSLGHEVLNGKDGQYRQSQIPLNSNYELKIENPDCYEFKETLSFTRPGKNDKTVILNKRLGFSAEKEAENLLHARDYPFAPRWDANFVLGKIPEQAENSELLEDFASRYQLRDCAFDPVGNRVVAINAKESRIWVYSADSSGRRTGQLEPNLSGELKSPEGIAVDSNGHVFITDWGNHQVVELTNDGQFLNKFGSFGTNTTSTVGEPVKFTFPTRIVVWEDTEGVQINDNTFYREKYLLVADRNGIHLCKVNGGYLDTLIAPSNDFSEGWFYAFDLQGYGQAAKLYLVNRSGEHKGHIFEFSAK
ncbi:hypothetical protein GWN90_25165 [candidate division KSB1 bacterium]|nr:hypothetical protein [candidate division KSB1 bacterium]NIS27235.1 hypothetical protein [candidate division KSB1 bacterium]